MLAPSAMAILDRYIGEAVMVLPKYFGPDCCIAAARITKTVLERFHFHVQPLAVRVIVSNPLLVAKGRLPADDDEARAWVAEGCWQVVNGGEPGRPMVMAWQGHLATLINGRLLLDLLLGQLSEPAKRIKLEPLLVPVESDFIAGKLTGNALMNDCTLQYTAFPADGDYQRVPDWFVLKRTEKAVRDILWRMK